ncbi:hypothetical protein PIB30_063917 [Stylosanthes scabra]|uniref:Uncharacterized protein n=1 Tax=Stylosanthes scabra TaxID=79078 RepID=A0ABU6VNY8_9FABA|nr:hypothetical protein [Stylosanthes scabra]
MDQPLIIRLHTNAVIHERQDGIWFQSDSSMLFQHVDISIMLELFQVFLYNLRCGFREIRKVRYRFLSRQPNGRFVHLLVWLFNDEHVRVTFRCHCRLMPQHVMDFLVEVGEAGSPCGPPVTATPVCIAKSSVPDTKMAMDNSESDSGPAVVPKVVPVLKLIRPPLILTPRRRGKELIQVYAIQRDGLLTTKLPLHAVHMVIPDKHEKYNGNGSLPCLILALLDNPIRSYFSQCG